MNTAVSYEILLQTLKEKIRQARIKAAVSVNKELLSVYWEIGKFILLQQSDEGWGAKIIDKLAFDLKVEFPEIKGFSVRNLKYMRAFTEAYPQFVQTLSAQLNSNSTNGQQPIVQTLLAQLNWSHHTVLLDKIKSEEERMFYMAKAAENGWSVSVLKQQIDTELYKRQGKAITNFNNTLPNPQSDLAREMLKSPYVFDFIGLSEDIQEREFEKALIEHLKKFMLELGKGFAYVGNQYNLVVGGDDYFLDLLFYNYNLHCFILFELKVGDFKPEFAGKLNFYVNTINEKMKGENDQLTIGVLLCKTPNKTVVKYSLDGIATPIGVANYELSQALPEKYKSEMPTIEELEYELEKEAEKLQNPIDKKLDHLKQLIVDLNREEVAEIKTKENIKQIFTQIILPIRQSTDTLLTEKISYLFRQVKIRALINGSDTYSDDTLLACTVDSAQIHIAQIEMELKGFKPAGIESFDILRIVEFKFGQYKYDISIGNQKHENLYTGLYHRLPSNEEIIDITNKIFDMIVEQISQRVKEIKKV